MKPARANAAATSWGLESFGSSRGRKEDEDEDAEESPPPPPLPRLEGRHSPEAEHGEVCPYATVQLVKQEEKGRHSFASLHHQVSGGFLPAIE